VKAIARSIPQSHLLLASLCAGIAWANAVRLHGSGPAVLIVTLAALPALVGGRHRGALLAVALAAAGWWWGSARLGAIDRSPLEPLLGTAERARVVVTGSPRRSRFDLRVPASVQRFGAARIEEPVLLELPVGRAPAQGDVLDVLGVLEPPRGPEGGFDELTWLRRHGVHAVLHGDRWQVVGHRGGLGGLADRVRAWITSGLRQGASGERRAVLLGVVLGADEGLSEGLRDRFRASGLYHLLAVSGQNVALVAGGALLAAWLAGLPRVVAELGALAAIAGYVLAVGAQPSVIRAGVAGALGSLAWLLARERDRWWFLLLGALALLAWNPYTVLDAGFQLSFAAVVSIFTLVPRLVGFLDGYPIPRPAATFLAVSVACSVATAPILWLQFHAIPLLAVPANMLAAPAMPALLGLALSAAAFHPLAPSAAVALTWLAGWCAAYLALCARTIGGLPFAQVRSDSGAAAILLCAGLAATYAWRRCRQAT
jgi:competence protein ComEC